MEDDRMDAQDEGEGVDLDADIEDGDVEESLYSTTGDNRDEELDVVSEQEGEASVTPRSERG
jgi:hypothetical protein